jgi:hypothetical protein
MPRELYENHDGLAIGYIPCFEAYVYVALRITEVRRGSSDERLASWLEIHCPSIW